MPPVKLSDILDAVESVGEETHAFLDRQTGEVIVLMDEHLRAAEEEDGEDLVGLGEWERECVEQAKAVQGDESGRFLPLPDRFEVNEWEMMRSFAEGLENEEQGEALLNAIQGRGAFRHFKDRTHEFGLADAWYSFRDGQYRQIALDWCEENEVEVDQNA